MSSAIVTHASTDQHAEWGGTKRYIRVIVHPDTIALQRAAKRYRPEMDTANTPGCFHPAPDRERYDEATGEWQQTTDPHWAGVLRLSRQHIDTEVVTHECVHAAAAIYRMDVATRINLGNGCREREETLAHIIGDVTHAVVDSLYRAGIYPDAAQADGWRDG